jgi:cyclohexa-1,5-dienecarbonyl-CoA hydratase
MAGEGGVRHAVNDGIARVTLDHPPANILTKAILGELRSAMAAVADEPAVGVLLLAAEGKHFSAGADVREHLPPTFRQLIPQFIETIRLLWEFPLPVVAAVRGRCLGGGFELAQAADFIVAGEGAVFGQPEIALGVFPPAACGLLPHLCDRSRAAELVLIGDSIGAKEAREWGLVARVVPDDRVEAEALAFAARLTRHSAAALRSAKRALRAAANATPADALDAAGWVYEDQLMRTADAVEGLTAFLEKRPPVWVHR